MDTQDILLHRTMLGRTNNTKDRYLDTIPSKMKRGIKITKRYDPGLKRPILTSNTVEKTCQGVEQIQNYLNSQNALNELTEIK